MKVQIMPDGLHAKELNPLGEEPNHLDYKHERYKGELTFISENHKLRYAANWEAWFKAEDERKVYEIYLIGVASLAITRLDMQIFQPGTIHEAERIPGTD